MYLTLKLWVVEVGKVDACGRFLFRKSGHILGKVFINFCIKLLQFTLHKIVQHKKYTVQYL